MSDGRQEAQHLQQQRLSQTLPRKSNLVKTAPRADVQRQAKVACSANSPYQLAQRSPSYEGHRNYGTVDSRHFAEIHTSGHDNGAAALPKGLGNAGPYFTLPKDTKFVRQEDASTQASFSDEDEQDRCSVKKGFLAHSSSSSCFSSSHSYSLPLERHS